MASGSAKPRFKPSISLSTLRTTLKSSFSRFTGLPLVRAPLSGMVGPDHIKQMRKFCLDHRVHIPKGKHPSGSEGLTVLPVPPMQFPIPSNPTT